ncbi:flavodoxin family protein [candidate division KSB1 bacterium]|nr:MAG: flavodoxin family protein [candidate division KSB1 bacterium]MBC6950325.1 flavodoxin family protein [candidate division KSB1 bacterium]MCE7942695.1 flavodoxin family protein [Chlorobi bacterium CHB1]MDL1875123.1 flavodoxin family protein [Cytophagia bacterium CHB2]
MRSTICVAWLTALLLSSAHCRDSVHVLIVYHSEAGHTQTMAEAVARGARSVSGVKVTLLPVAEATNENVLAADAIILGSPVHNANVTPALQQFINRWPFEGEPLRDKIGAAFVTAGGMSAGEELVQMNILHSMLIFGMIVVGGPDWRSAFGASGIVEEEPFKTQTGEVATPFLAKGEALGKRVAELAKRLSTK